MKDNNDQNRLGISTAPGEMTRRIREHDWTRTPLGPVEKWPEALKTSLGMVLAAKTPMAIYWGPELVLLYNDAFRPIIGAKHSEALGKPGRAVLPEVWNELEPLFDAVMKRGEAVHRSRHLFRLQRYGKREDGWFDYGLSPIFVADGSVGGVFNVANEVTKELRSEKALKKSQKEHSRQRRFLESVLDQAQAIIGVVEGPSLRFTLVNPAYQALQPDTTVIGRTFREVFTESAEAGGEALLLHVLATGAPFHDHHYHSPIPGKPDAVWDLQVRRLPVDGTEEPSLLIIGFDVTEHVRTQKELQKSEKRFREAFEHAPIGMTMNRLDGKFIHANDAYCRMVGYTLEEIAVDGFDFQKLTHPDDLEYNLKLLHQLLAGEIPAFYLEKRYIRRDKTIIWVRASASLRRDYAGVPIQIIGLVEDITPRKEAEEQLRQAQKMEAIGHLAGGIAHEFNNMLTVITGNADILDVSLDRNDPLKRNVDQILGSAERSARMVHQLLGYSRKQMIRPKTIDVNETIAKQISFLNKLIREDIEVRFEAGRDVWNIDIDPAQLDQILSNLAVNARDAIPAEGVVTIATQNVHIAPADAERDLPAGDYVKLTFADTGVGMDENTLQRLFDPYFTTKEVGEGTGLGLPTVYGIVKQNGGAIHVDSAPGQGAVFTIFFPCSPSETDREVERKRKTKQSEGTVLVVEDEPQVLDLTKSALEAAGYRVLTAETPSAALRVAKTLEGRIDLLLTDVVMPEFDGRSLRAMIKDIRPRVRTLFMSGYSERELGSTPLETEEELFIRKPFSAAELTAKVREALRNT